MIEILQATVKRTVLSALVGVLAGSASAIFLFLLDVATKTRESWPLLIVFLPVAGWAVGWMYFRWGKGVEAGNSLLLEEIHNPKAPVKLRMFPLILIGTVVTHLFGGSAGREGTAVQMGGAIADQLAKPFRLSVKERRGLLMAGMSGGFGSVFGVPFAGGIFGLEVLFAGRMEWKAALECFVASFVGHYVCLAWGIHHSHYVAPEIPSFGLALLGSVLVAGGLFGLCALTFSRTIHGVQKIFARWMPNTPTLRPVVGGAIVAGLYWLLGTTRFAGLGVEEIQRSVTETLPPLDFLAKLVLTALTLGSGFKGGEVTPLLFIGATMGNSLGSVLAAPTSLLAAVGFVAVFAGAANTPWACTVMAMEIFGPQVGVFAALACWMSFAFSGGKGIYGAQRLHKKGKLMGIGLGGSLAILLVCFSVSRAHADAVESDTSLGKNTFVEDLNAHGTFGNRDKKKDTVFTWSGGLTSTKATSQDPTTGAKVTDTTRDVSASFGLKTPKQFGADLGFDYASTPDEHLTQHGPNLGLSYTYVFGLHDESFHPDVGVRLSFANVDYDQVFAAGFVGRRKGVVRPIIGENDITQRAPTLSFTGNPLSWLSLKIAFTTYSYNRDPNQFLTYLDSLRVLRNRTTGLSSIVTGFPKNESLIQASFDLSEEWSLLVSEVVAHSIVDGSKAYTTKLIFSKDLGEDWNLGFGVENDKSEDVKDNLLLVNVKYFF